MIDYYMFHHLERTLKMKWNSGFDRPALRRRMVTKGQKYSMYRMTTEFEIEKTEEELEKENPTNSTESY